MVFNKVHAAYREVFDLDSPAVRTVLSDMCKAHGVFNGGFSVNPYENAFNSGERNTVLRVFTLIKANADDFIELAKEIQNEE